MTVRRIQINRVASATRNAGLSEEVIIGEEILAQEGCIVAVRILNNKYQYNTIEDTTGRMVKLHAGDTLAGVLGFRRALKGYAGVVPESLKVGDRVHVLNLGGVLGLCTAENPELGSPFEAEVLGAVLEFPDTGDRIGRPASIRSRSIIPSEKLELDVPLVCVAGTCMNSGKTVAAAEIVRGLSNRGKRVAACKLTGVSLMRDTLAMTDAGAMAAADFTDAGAVSTRGGVILPIVRGILNHLSRLKPDLIVAELGDGILGEYGVQDILQDRAIMAKAVSHVMCAPDPVAIYGAKRIFEQDYQLSISAVAGPVTDNSVGQDYIRGQLKLKAHNARYDIERLLDVVEGDLARAVS